MARRAARFTAAGIAALTLVVYVQLLGFDFVRFDDPRYVTENPVVRAGLSLDGVVWAFTTFHESNWHPLTWLSHMLDVELFGLDAAGHHATSVLLHVGERAARCSCCCARMTGAAPERAGSRRSSRCTRCTSSRWRGSPSARTC